MVLYYTLFLFAAFGLKLILALAMIYMLLPTHRSCDQCGEETLLIQQTGAGRIVTRFSFGRLHRRWCPRCDWYGLARRVPPPPPALSSRAGSRTRSPR